MGESPAAPKLVPSLLPERPPQSMPGCTTIVSLCGQIECSSGGRRVRVHEHGPGGQARPSVTSYWGMLGPPPSDPARPPRAPAVPGCPTGCASTSQLKIRPRASSDPRKRPAGTGRAAGRGQPSVNVGPCRDPRPRRGRGLLSKNTLSGLLEEAPEDVLRAAVPMRQGHSGAGPLRACHAEARLVVGSPAGLPSPRRSPGSCRNVTKRTSRRGGAGPAAAPRLVPQAALCSALVTGNSRHGPGEARPKRSRWC